MNIESQNSHSTFSSSRMKRKLNLDDQASLKVPGTDMKRNKGRRALSGTFDPISDKENFHKSKDLAPRSRPARVLVDLIIDLPTDCSDFEISDVEADSALPHSAELFHKQIMRMTDVDNKHYHFTVFEDHRDSST